MRICIVGDERDLSATYVGWLARRRGAQVLTLAEAEYGVGWTFRLEESPLRCTLEVEGSTYPLSEISGAFVRFNPEPLVNENLGIQKDIEGIYTLERRYGIQWLLNNTPFPVVNPPSGGRSNCSKPYQMKKLSENGLRVPEWIVTNSSDTARKFVGQCGGKAIYKSCSGLRSRVRVVDESLLAAVGEGTSPVILQRYIGGSDVRVHVVGKKIFATEIVSEAVDYRFDSVSTRYRSIHIPQSLTEQCIAATADEGLLLSGLDFRLSPDGIWWCLELNPVPTFLPYEASTGHPIGHSILDIFGIPDDRDVATSIFDKNLRYFRTPPA